jgi:hypothetical protein
VKGGKWAKWRTGKILPSGEKECSHLATGDTFYVQFSFEKFKNNNPDDEKVRK